MYDIGILGGMGPLATSVLFDMLIEQTNAKSDQDHLNIVCVNKTVIPDRTAFLLDSNASDPLPKLKEGINELNKLCPKIVVIPCNTSHYFINQLQRISTAPILNMVDNTLKYISESSLPKSVVVFGTLGTVKTQIYERFNTYGLSIYYPSEEECKKIHEIIYSIKNHGKKELYLCAKSLTKIISDICLRYDEKMVFVLGCTELSVLNSYVTNNRSDIIDPMELLALSAIISVGKEINFIDKYDINILYNITKCLEG